MNQLVFRCVKYEYSGHNTHKISLIIRLPCVSGQLSGHPHVALPGLEAVDAADVVQAPAHSRHQHHYTRALVPDSPARHVVAAGRVGTRHDPGAAQRDGVHLVGGVAVPHDQLPVLRIPMHCIFTMWLRI